MSLEELGHLNYRVASRGEWDEVQLLLCQGFHNELAYIKRDCLGSPVAVG